MRFRLVSRNSKRSPIKLQRDQLAESLDFQGQVYDYNNAQDFNWGGSAATISNYRPQ